MQEAYANYVRDYYLGSFGASVRSYDQQHLKDTSVGEEDGNMLPELLIGNTSCRQES